MVADAVSARARTSIPYAGRLLLTLFLLALYVFGRRLPLPGIDVEAMLSYQIGRNLWSILSLDLTPLITGFILGILEGLTKVFYPEASNTVIFVVMAIVLLVRPAGLFGKQA